MERMVQEKRRREFQMVPMVDIVFQLIIFFLVATQVKQSDTPPVVLPTARNPEEIKEEGEHALVVNVLRAEMDKATPYVVMGQQFDINGLKKFLKDKKSFLRTRGGDMPILRIRADKDSQFKEVQEALIACREIKIWKIRLSAIKKKD